MNRNSGVCFLILCFSLSSVNAGLADQVVNISPVIVQPNEVQELNQEMLERDRQNRDEEWAIKQLVEENDKLTQNTLVQQQDEGLAKINHTMLSYRDALLSRDRARIVANGERGWVSRYGDLVALTEDADGMTVHRDLEDKSSFLAEKYQMLTELKDEMTALNEKLRSQQEEKLNQKKELADSYTKIAQEQQNKIQMLVGRLGEVDKKIAHMDDILAEKDRQIALLKDDLVRAQNESVTKDEIIRNQKNQIAILQSQTNGLSSIKEKQDQLDLLKSELENKITESNGQGQTIKQLKDQIAVLQSQSNALSAVSSTEAAQDAVIKEKQDQLDLLKSELENKITELNGQGQKDGTIKQLKDQIAVLQEQLKNVPSSSAGNVKLPPVIISAVNQQQTPTVTKSQADQIAQVQKENLAKDEVIKQQDNQIALLKAQEISSKQNSVDPQADQIVKESEQLKDQSALYTDVKNQVEVLKNMVREQGARLKAKDESIRWLNKVLEVFKDKAKYYQLTSQLDQIPMKQVQEEVQGIKDDFARRFKDYDKFENDIGSLKDQVSKLVLQLSQKQAQVDQLKSELDKQNIQDKNQNQQQTQLQQDLKAQLQDKEDQIVKMKADILSILKAQADKEIYHRKAAAQVDDRVNLAKQLIALQQQEAALLDEKGNLEATQSEIFEKHTADLFNKINTLMVNHRTQVADLQSRMQEFKNDLDQKQQEADSLETQLKNKIVEEKNEGMLARQIQDLTAQLRDEEEQIAAMKTRIQEGQKTMEEADTLKQQLAAEQDSADQLKQQLDTKNSQSDQMTLMMADYQKKLEAKNNAYNQQLRQVLLSKNYQGQMEKQIADLSVRLQDKEAQIVNIKKDMYDLQESTNAKDRDIQTKDLSLSMVQQKMMDDKINEYQNKINALHAASVSQARELTSLRADLALAREELEGKPSSDEIDFLRTGFEKANEELKQKDIMLSQIKANADEYKKEFKEQSREFRSLKDQLQDAYVEINHRNEDLKYKEMEVIRLKERTAVTEGDLKDQIRRLTSKIVVPDKKFMGIIHGNKVEVLRVQLTSAYAQIKDLQDRINGLESFSKGDAAGQKIKQALNKIDEQGRLINILAQKLQDCGQSVDLTKYTSRQ